MTPGELETVSHSEKLRDVYSYRWWSVDLHDSYFTFYNNGLELMKAGDQVTFSYGCKANHELVEVYGFSLEAHENPYANYKFRVVRGVSSETAIDDEDELLISQKILDDFDNIEKRTDVVVL